MKIAVVTGASYGIGEAITDSLLKEGFKVYGLSRSKPAFKTESFVWLKCDLALPGDIKACADSIVEAQIDVLVSNAGVIYTENPLSVTEEIYDRTFSVNVLAPMLLVNELQHKIQTAHVLSVSSVSDRIPEASVPMYSSSKAANTMYFNTLAQELGNAKVVTLLPDYVDTPMQHRSNDGNSDFDWSATIQSVDIARLCMDIIEDKIDIETGSNIIIVTEKLKDDLVSVEKLYGFNTDSATLTRLN